MNNDTQEKQTESAERFAHIIGQHKLKKQLNFYIDGCKKTGTLPNLGLLGPKGNGKTMIAEATKEYVVGDKGEGLLVNSSTLPKNPTDFIELFWNRAVHDRNVFMVLDEAHELPKGIVGLLLSILQVTKDPVSRISVPDIGGEIVVDRRKFKCAVCTTERHKLFAPLLDRLTVLDFSPYSDEELGQIVQVNAPDIDFEGDVLKEIATVLRGSPRTACKIASNIFTMAETNMRHTFNREDWDKLKDLTGINPMGLTEDELNYLKRLERDTESTVTQLSAGLGHPKRVINEIEAFLLKSRLIRIGGNSVREITPDGRKVCRNQVVH